MHFAEDRDIGEFAIRRYGPEGIEVNETLYPGPLLLTPERLETTGLPATLEALDEACLRPWLADRPEILLLGTGSRLRFPDPRLIAWVEAAGTGCEVMDTPAACRTWNILASDRRRVVALLFPL
ncbi:MAG: hypothetical protein D6721_06570 [Gammaproteobacteria bacterium]|nr:MAG: hypothetical protein D6721_06570 [Gammaproteobacteria bacterium]